MSYFGSGRKPAAVSESPELERVIGLETRPPLDVSSARASALVELMTGRLLRSDRRHDGGDCRCASMGRRCIVELLPVQAWALWEAGLVGGLVGAIGIGQGKTAIGMLTPMVVPGCRQAALLIPPGLVGQFVRDYEAWREHFRVPNLVVAGDHWLSGDAPVLHVLPYSKLSRPEATTLLDEMQVDTVIADEAHHLRGPTAARTRRFLRLFLARPSTKLFAWSGTITSQSLREFAHLLAIALGDGSPLPIDPSEVEVWAAAVDPSDWPAPPGALSRLVRATGASDVRSAVRARLVSTRGVISTADGSPCAASIVMRERRPPPPPPPVAAALKGVRQTWTRPDGEELVEAVETARCLREIASGFYYRWRFPGDPSPELLDEWFEARREWHRELRGKLSFAGPHMDSPFLCAAAAERARVNAVGDAPVWHARTWARWVAVRDLVDHETEVVWLSDWLVQDAAGWASRNRGVVWYAHDAFGSALRAAGVPSFSGGDAQELRAAIDSGVPAVALSIRAYGTGFDGLQRRYSKMLVANPPSSGDAWEQMIGRMHRRGQEGDTVECDVYRHTPEVSSAVDKAVSFAKYVEGVTGGRQALLVADVEWDVSRRPLELRPPPAAY